MRAAMYYGNHKLEIEDIPEPSPGEGQVKVRVSRHGICGTVLHEYDDGPIFIPPDQPHPLTGKAMRFALRGMGLTEIDVVEPSPTRRTSIEALGARTLDPTALDVPELIADRTDGDGVDATFDAAGVTPAVESALECLGERRPLISVAIYDKPISTPLINLVLRERRIQGTICYTGDDYRAVIALMAQGHYDTTGWVDTIPMSGVLEQGFEELRAGRKMKLLVDPTV